MRNKLIAMALMSAAFSGGSAMQVANPHSDISGPAPLPAGGASGKGKGKKARSAKKPGRYSRNHYPFSSDRQDARTARTQHMVVVNGFPLMRTIPARDRKAPVVALAA